MQKPLVRLFFVTSCAALTLMAACGDDSGTGTGGAAGTGATAGQAPTSGSGAGGNHAGGGQASAGNQTTGGQAGTHSPNIGGLGGTPEVDGGTSSGGGDAGLAGEGGHNSDAGTAGASEAGAGLGGVASAGAAGVGGVESGGAAGANSEVDVPQELQEFESAVATAVAQAQQDGSKNCARAIPAVPVASAKDAWAKVREFIALVVGVKPAALTEDLTECGPPAAPCANFFQNDVYHSDGRLGDALYPFAQQVDTDTETDRVVIFTPEKDNISQPPVVVTAGVSDGFLMGVAFFDGRATCE